MFERVFKLKDNNTNVKTEVVAGITTFMTMAYKDLHGLASDSPSKPSSYHSVPCWPLSDL